MTARQIYGAARELLDPSERARYIGESCGGDASLSREVEALLVGEPAGSGLHDEATIEFNSVPEIRRSTPCPVRLLQHEAAMPWFGKSDPNRALEYLVRLYDAWGQRDKTAEWRAKLRVRQATSF